MYRDINLREYIEKILEMMEKARDLQAKELARRLEELNHAHARMVEEPGS